MTLKALDLFCGGGGATRGLQLAGYDVVGIDSNTKLRRHYEKTGAEFILGDALDTSPDMLSEFDLIWSSPPCQRFSKQAKQHGYEHPDLIDQTRQMLLRANVPFIIENVPGSPVRKDLWLCGTMFGLELARHRHFEIYGITIQQPKHYKHEGRIITVSGHAGGQSTRDGATRYGNKEDWQRAMEIDWLPTRVLSQAIPPVYSQFIAEHLN